jgi:hypothetical protein
MIGCAGGNAMPHRSFLERRCPPFLHGSYDGIIFINYLQGGASMESMPVGFNASGSEMRRPSENTRGPVADTEEGVKDTFDGSGVEKDGKAKKKKEAPAPDKVKVLEVDQWTSTGNIQNFTMESFDMRKMSGGDSEAARQIFGGHAAIREVSPNESPSIGEVWYISDPKTKKLKFFKANYDSSD